MYIHKNSACKVSFTFDTDSAVVLPDGARCLWVSGSVRGAQVVFTALSSGRGGPHVITLRAKTEVAWTAQPETARIGRAKSLGWLGTGQGSGIHV